MVGGRTSKKVVKKTAAPTRKQLSKEEACQSGYWGCYIEDTDGDPSAPDTEDSTRTHHMPGCYLHTDEFSLACGCKMKGRALLKPCPQYGEAGHHMDLAFSIADREANDPLGFAARVGLDAADDPMPEDLTEKVLNRVKEEQQKTNHLVMGQLLTVEEHEVIDTLGRLAGQFSDICGNDAMNRGNDMWEAVIHIHALQNMVLAQAAARAFPDSYRLMGEPAVNRVKEESDD